MAKLWVSIADEKGKEGPQACATDGYSCHRVSRNAQWSDSQQGMAVEPTLAREEKESYCLLGDHSPSLSPSLGL